MKKLILILLFFLLSISQGVEARLIFSNEQAIWDGSDFVIDVNDEAATDIDLKFGATATGRIRFNVGSDQFEFNESVNLEGNQLVDARIENNAAAPTCDTANAGRVYYDTAAGSGYVCEQVTPSVFNWVDMTVTPTASSSKVVTVGTGGNYSTIAAAAAYLNPLTGGIILLTPETHAVTSAVDLQGITIIGSHPTQSNIDITGVGILQVKDTIFENLTLTVNAGITADSGLDVKYNATTTSSLVFNWVDFDIGGSKTLVESTAGTAPTLITRFVSASADVGSATIVAPKVSSGLNTIHSLFVFSSQGGDGALMLNDWDVSISGASNVVTSGDIETTPDSTIFAYPGMNLQQALNSLTSGGLVTLLPGTHNITEPLLITNDSVTIEGYGDSSVIEASGFSGIVSTTAAIQLGSANGTTPVKGVSLNHFKLEVNGSNIHGIRAAGGTDIQVSNVTVEKTAGTALNGTNAKIGILLMDGSSTPLLRPVIKGSRVFGAPGRYFTDGIHVTGEGVTPGVFGSGNGVQNALVEGNSVDYVRETAAAFVHVSDSSLFNNRFTRMGGGGGQAYGIYMGRISRTNMTNNIVSGSLSVTSIAIGVESFNIGTDPTTKNSVFTGNVIDGTANGGVGFGTGFQVGATTATTVENNLFQQNSILGASGGTTVGFLLRGDADQNSISNNVISGGTNPWDTGVQIAGANANSNLIRGSILNNVTGALANTGSDTFLGVIKHINTVDPTVNNDRDEGYNPGTFWINVVADTTFVLVDPSSGAAIWKEITASGGGGVDSTDSEIFTIDNDDTGGDLALQFGTTLSETLIWNATTTTFELSDGLNLEDDLTVGGTTETLSDPGFTLDGDDAYIAGSLGVEGPIYTDDTQIKYEWLDIFGCIRGSASAGNIAGRSPVIRFDGVDNSQMRCSVSVPDDWVSGTDINLNVFWTPSDNTAGNLFFDFDYASLSLGDTIVTGIFTDTNITTESVTASTQGVLSAFDMTIPSSDIILDDILNFRFQRAPGNAGDTYESDINIHLIRMAYTGKKLR